MKHFEKHLDAALRQNGWLHEETLDLKDYWKASRAWLIRSTNTNFGYELVLTFVGGYMDGNTVEFAAPIWAIVAAEEIQTGFCEYPELMVDGRDFPHRAETFVAGLREWFCERERSTRSEPDDDANQIPL